MLEHGGTNDKFYKNLQTRSLHINNPSFEGIRSTQILKILQNEP